MNSSLLLLLLSIHQISNVDSPQLMFEFKLESNRKY
jgi:hypothetical protein